MIYAGQKIVFATMHGKEKQAARLFKTGLGAEVFVPENLDTDALGTFSGEVERKSDALSVARKKCRLGMKMSGCKIGLASEGSFGPHPVYGFFPAGREVLYFIDDINGFETHEYALYERTNYAQKILNAPNDLNEFLNQARFPSHAIILRPHIWDDKMQIEKGITSHPKALESFERFKSLSEDGQVWAETDMRAHLNPMRRHALMNLSKRLIKRLATPCPSCALPGWGRVDVLAGLPCELCAQPTDSVKADIWGCVQCKYKEERPRGKEKADPANCVFCNP
ncbi:MAG: DUF6671 family protein [Alphaproteobacteria bacterium]